jgi:hypothetical protein
MNFLKALTTSILNHRLFSPDFFTNCSDFMKKNLFIAFVLLTALYACGVKSASKASSSDLATGKSLYMGKCGGCHPAFDVKSKSVERWREVLHPMIQDKAKMNEADGKLVEAYVWNELGVKG